MNLSKLGITIMVGAAVILSGCTQTVTYYDDPVCQGLQELKTKRQNENTGQIIGDVLSLALGVVPTSSHYDRSSYSNNRRTTDDVNIEQIKLGCRAKTKTVQY